MLRRIETTDNIPAFIEGVKGGKERLMGFGHRVYKNYDPRATIIKKACDDVFEVTGVNPLLAIAVELERIALEDEYFVKRKLYPNVDFYSGLIYEALGMPADMFTVLFAIGRTPGWVAQWAEMLQDKEQKISRPRQIYVGSGRARLRGDRLAVGGRRRPGGGRRAAPARRRPGASQSRSSTSPRPGSASSATRRPCRVTWACTMRRSLGCGRRSTSPPRSSPSTSLVTLGRVTPSSSPSACRQARRSSQQQSTSSTSSLASERPKPPAWRSSRRSAAHATRSSASLARRASSARDDRGGRFRVHHV